MGSAPNDLSLAFVEALYMDFLRDPESVSVDWREYFGSLNGGSGPSIQPKLEPTFRPPALFNARSPFCPRRGQCEREVRMAFLQQSVTRLIDNYRAQGHIIAHLDPLGLPRPEPPELNPSYYGFTEQDMDSPFFMESRSQDEPDTLRNILKRIRNTYCRSIGVQFVHIEDSEVRKWLQERMEGSENRCKLSRDSQLRILTLLTDAVIFEEFVQKKYVGAKRFSLEGAESLIPLLESTIVKAADQGAVEVTLGMAHRGRLNVLANIIRKSPRKIFREFEDLDPELHTGRGDVKYHLGYSNDWVTPSGAKVHLSLSFNPSHLEYVSPVVLGRVRAKQDRTGDVDGSRRLAILIHGDASFAGEGVVQETLNLSELDDYTTRGAVHVIVNNQIGFTTDPSEGRSSTYATAVGKMLQIPIFHVNGEDPEAVAQVVDLSMDFRREFKRGVIIDMYCYRRRGHSEGDEPAFTQPLLYKAIKARKTVREGYLEHLLKLGEVTQQEADDIAKARHAHLEEELKAARSSERLQLPDTLGGIWSRYYGGPDALVPETDTGVAKKHLTDLIGALTRLPEGFKAHPKIVQWLEHRQQMGAGERSLDWSAAEALAFATVAVQGYRVRLSGQDCQRGTFSHRHAVLHDMEDNRTYMALNHLSEEQAPVDICNSPLSEAAVMGFEYGYSLDCPDGLVLWEAQFGDFCNVAQVIIDQFIASAEDKWRRLSGLVLLLPHGFDGMGPEHSSARLERFLSLTADDNFQVIVPTTPAQYFHVLRRQVLRPWRKPLIVMAPKSLLRHPEAVSPLEELTTGRFQRILGDSDEVNKKKVKRLLCCSGKIYYDLARKRKELGRDDVGILRIEQLYPLEEEHLREALAGYPAKTPIVWVQEEPRNMGAWRHLRARFGAHMLGAHPFTCVSRPASASPATGSASSHKLEQEELIQFAFSADTPALRADR